MQTRPHLPTIEASSLTTSKLDEELHDPKEPWTNNTNKDHDKAMMSHREREARDQTQSLQKIATKFRGKPMNTIKNLHIGTTSQP